MKTLLVIFGAAFVLAVSGAGAFLAINANQNRDLKSVNHELRQEVAALERELEEFKLSQAETTRRFELALDESMSLSNRLQELEASAASTPATNGILAQPRPYQVRAWLGQELLGWAWIMPQYARTDSETGVPQYEPVVWIDEKVRDKFVTHVTNVVDRPVSTSYTTVNNRYYPYPIYYRTSPHHRGPSASPQPSAPSIQPFDPGTGGLPASHIGTPAATIKTRPQVLGTPANQIKTQPKIQLVSGQ